MIKNYVINAGSCQKSRFEDHFILMPEIKDTGKIWIRGQVGTVFALRVDDRVFVPGQEETQSIEYWLNEGNLCIDLHDASNRIRLARCFPLNLNPKHPAALFSGFTKTKHDDTQVVLFDDEGVITRMVNNPEYEENRVGEMSSRDFWNWLGWSA